MPLAKEVTFPESVVPLIEAGLYEKAESALWRFLCSDWKEKDPVTHSRVRLLLADIHLRRGGVLNARHALRQVKRLGVTDQGRYEQLYEQAQHLDSTPGERFRPDPARIMYFTDHVLVICGRCSNPGIVHREKTRFTCGSCAGEFSHSLKWTNSRDPAFYLGFELLLKVRTRHGLLWAYNEEHLAQLKALVGSKIRMNTPGYGLGGCCYSAPWWQTLPSWVTSAKNREEILKALTKMEALIPN